MPLGPQLVPDRERLLEQGCGRASVAKLDLRLRLRGQGLGDHRVNAGPEFSCARGELGEQCVPIGLVGRIATHGDGEITIRTASHAKWYVDVYPEQIGGGEARL